MIDGRFTIAMQREKQKIRARQDRPGGKNSGWLAFGLGMIGMFVVMALWVALVETAGESDNEVEFIGRPQSDSQPFERDEPKVRDPI